MHMTGKRKSTKFGSVTMATKNEGCLSNFFLLHCRPRSSEVRCCKHRRLMLHCQCYESGQWKGTEDEVSVRKKAENGRKKKRKIRKVRAHFTVSVTSQDSGREQRLNLVCE